MAPARMAPAFPRAADRRTVRTVAAIEDALRALLAETSLDAISVTALCDRAGIKRQSFYTHFESVPVLAAQLLTADFDELLPVAGVVRFPFETAEAMVVDNLADALRLVARERALYRSVLSSRASGVLRQTLGRAIGVRVVNIIDLWQHYGRTGEVDLEIAVPFATGGIVRAIEAWAMSEHGADQADVWARGIRDQMPWWWPKPPFSA